MSNLEHLVSSCGWTTLATSTALNFYQRVSMREILLRQITELMLQYGATGVIPKGLSPSITDEDIDCAIAEYEFVLDVLDRLDINNTIDHSLSYLIKYGRYDSMANNPNDVRSQDYFDRVFTDKWGHIYGDMHFRKAFNQYYSDRPKRDIIAQYCSPRLPAKRDDAYKMCFELSYSTRASEYRQRLQYECQLALKNEWFMVFDTLTLEPTQVAAFANSPNAIRDYCRSIGRLVNQALGLSARDSVSDVYKYFCVPEYGGKTGRLHFHILHLMKALPSGTRDPNSKPFFRAGRSIRKYREVGSLKGLWPYGFTTPIACRYSNDAFSRAGWLWPTDADGVPIENKPVIAIARYITKYITKNLDLQKYKKLNPNYQDDLRWKKMMQLSKLPEKSYRVRMSRNFGTIQAPLENLSDQEICQLANLPMKVTQYPRLLKRAAKRILRKRLGAQSIKNVLAVRLPPQNLIALLRNTILLRGTSKELSFTDLIAPKLSVTDIFDSVLVFIKEYGLEYYDPKKVFAVSAK